MVGLAKALAINKQSHVRSIDALLSPWKKWGLQVDGGDLLGRYRAPDGIGSPAQG
jgi:hypothetical protein